LANIRIPFLESLNFSGGKFPTGASLDAACRICEGRVESKELNDPVSVLLRWPVLVLLPFLNRRVGDPKAQLCSQLRHGKVKVDALLAEVFADGFGVDGVIAQTLKMLRRCASLVSNRAVATSQQAQFAR
jgi:hypothetical protein